MSEITGNEWRLLNELKHARDEILALRQKMTVLMAAAELGNAKLADAFNDKARAEALEEAAQTCERYDVTHRSPAAFNAAYGICAAAIRALKDRQ